MKTLSQKFAFAQYYIVPLPGSLSVRNGLNPVSRDQIEKRARLVGLHPYEIFIDEIKSRIKTFLKANSECHDVSKIMDVDDIGQVHGELYFSCTEDNMKRLANSFAEMFADMSLLPVITRPGQHTRMPSKSDLFLDF